MKYKSEQAYNSASFESVSDQLRQNVSVSDEDFARMKTELVDKFMKEYEGQKIE